MDITRRSDYACRMLRAAYRSQGKYLSVTDIAEQESIPYSFARSIQHDLVKNGLVKTMRGVHGGLILNCDPKEVTMLEVLEAVQGPVSVAPCVIDPETCTKRNVCEYFQAWRGADKLLQDYFSSIVLHDLFELSGEHPVIKGIFEADK